MQQTTLLWFRQDLRLDDNPALQAAIQSGLPILPIFILDDETPSEWRIGGASRWWLHHSLHSLNESLKKIGGELLLFKGNSQDILNKLVKENNVQHVFWNRLYEPYAIARDKEIKQNLKTHGLNVESFQALLLHEPWSIKNKSGNCFQVYTPYSKTCFEVANHDMGIAPPDKINMAICNANLSLIDLDLLPKISWDKEFPNYWQPGENGAWKKFEWFLENAIHSYKEDRNRPDLPFVSRLSPHIHWGEISLRRVWNRVETFMHSRSDDVFNKNAEHFLKELLWREFAHHLLYHFPDLPESPLNKKFESFPWQEDNDALRQWQRGLTGYPIVDAGMRELWTTGWMHNRVRMIVGSFLVKNLRLHWRHGENWFWDCLVDADLANNAASWQWIAGCGADAAPYFRIFNPILQGQKFDPNGDYVRKFVPELATMPKEYIHRPWEAPPLILNAAGVELGTTYPKPIVDHAQARDRALEAFKELKKTG